MTVSGSPTEAISIRQRVAKLRRLLMIVTSLPTGIRLLSGRLMVRQDTLARFFRLWQMVRESTMKQEVQGIFSYAQQHLV